MGRAAARRRWGRTGAGSGSGHPGGLTDRELSILRLVAEGLSNLDIASKLYVTEQTVKFHLSNIYRKLDVSNRTEASRWAQVHGLRGDTSIADRAGFDNYYIENWSLWGDVKIMLRTVEQVLKVKGG